MNKRPSTLPVIIMTGASGFIGRHLITCLQDKYYIYAIARRTQKSVGISIHQNINWLRIDIGEEKSIKSVLEKIADNGGADFFVHLAGYYDFGNEPNPEYNRTNVNGTRYILETAQKLNLKRFIFTSSLTVTKFNKPGTILNENSPADAQFPYAVSKKSAEELIQSYSRFFPCSIIRLAAIYSDWCEYGPLYMFLSTWLSFAWNSRFLAGKGSSAVPYLHIKNLNRFFLKMLEISEQLPDNGIYIASPDGCTSHNELFEIARHYYFGHPVKPVFLPKWFSYIGVSLQDFLGKLIKKRPFVRPWMISYVDLRMETDASYTRNLLKWEPIPRYHIKRRLLFLIENMKSNPMEWNFKNQEALHKEDKILPNLIICETMFQSEESIIKMVIKQINSPQNKLKFIHYQQLEPDILKSRLEYIFRMLQIAIRTGDRMHILNYARNLAEERQTEGFQASEVILMIKTLADSIVTFLSAQPKLKNKEQWIYDEIMMTIQLIVDEIEDSYEEVKL